MNGYIIKHKGKVYATNADNLMDAEEKFLQEFGIDPVDYVEVIPLSSIGQENGIKKVIYF